MKKRNRISRSFAAAVAVAAMCASLPAVDSFAAQTLAGDVDKDGTVGVTDLVLLQKYIHGKASLDSTAYDNANVYADNAVDVFDLAVLKKMLLSETPVSNTVYIHLKGSSITVEGDDNKVVQISGTTAKITASGTYIVDGSITDGQLYIETAAEDLEDVELVLKGVTFTNTTKQAIYTAKETGSDKTKITLEGENVITDGAQTAYTDGAAAIYTNNKLTFTKNSTGSLTISSYFNDGLHAEKKINLNGGTINIDTDTVPEGANIVPDADGISSDKNIEIEGSIVNIDASGDGIKTDSGVYMIDGDVQIKAGNDAVQAATEIAVSGGNIVASGDRGFRLTGDATAGTNGALNITGGTVVATATDYQVNGNETIDASGSTQAIMLFDMAAEWKKATTITVGDQTFAANKKYDYVLISDPALKASETYKVYLGGQQAKHEGDAKGSFKNSGTVTQYKAVDLLSGGETVTTPGGGTVVSSIVYNSSSVALYDANGGAVDASAAENVKVSNGSYVTITKSGAYTISGASSNGQIKVATDDSAEPDAVVEMSFEGLELSNSSVAPVYIENVGDEAVISVKNGTTSTIKDGTSHTDTYTNSDGETKTCAAAIYARDDLKIKGKGTLVVEGSTEDGIVSTNDLKLWNGTINVTAADDAIRADSVKIGDTADATNYETLNITATSKAGDGIKATSTETGKGFVLVSGGSVTIKSYADGIQAEQDFTMNGGTLDIYTYQGSGYTGSGSTGGWGGGMGMDGNANKTDISAKGIKAVGLYDAAGTTYQSAGTITINGGTVKINSSDDAVHCAGAMAVNGGVFTIETADDGFHSDKTVAIGKTAANTFDDVQIYISKCYEGVEAPEINQNSGSVYIISGDDGYNAGGGADGSGSMNPGGPGQGWGQGSTTSNSSIVLNLNGGLAVVNSANGDHDAFDSNGDINVNGGYYCANGQEPLDCGDSGNSIKMNGGSVISMTGGNTNLTTKYTFVDSSGKAIVSFVSASGGGLRASSTASGKSGATVSGGTTVVAQAGDKAVTVGGTISGGSDLGQASEGGMGPGRQW
ncbi:MAG: carbohydrate-binding domain-containing protein [Oscillospiraceae bacterium]|nr:carbohydrate-binding domain-containing protein [Oscillospiraceae bacterium]